jgi:hypothetical protein
MIIKKYLKRKKERKLMQSERPIGPNKRRTGP